MIDLKAVNSQLWLMEPDTIQARLRQLADLVMPTADQMADFCRQQETALANALRPVKGKVAVLPIHGVIEHRLSPYAYYYGGCSTEMCERAIEQLVAAKDVDCILLDVDSPGGFITGVEELADMIFAAREHKRILAIANGLAASAAYWIASAASQFYAIPSGDVGSIGVYNMHVDYTEALAKEGVKVTIVKAGKYKAEMNPYEPLSDEARDYLQERVDDIYTKFIKAVARNRGVSTKQVRDEFGQGRVLGADDALAAGMIDKVLTPAQLFEKLGGAPTQVSSRASLDVLRLRQQQRKTAI